MTGSDLEMIQLRKLLDNSTERLDDRAWKDTGVQGHYSSGLYQVESPMYYGRR